MVLTAPSFGNTWNLDFKIVARRTLGNELKTVVDPNWPIIEKMTLIYENLTTALKDSMVAALLAAFGTQINMTDYEGEDWVGTVISDLTVTESKRRCGWSIQFDFEGTRV